MVQSIRFSEMDSVGASQKQVQFQRAAIKMLQNELDHYLGRERPAVNFSPFGRGDREYAGLGYNL
jgi:hypothetical protein